MRISKLAKLVQQMQQSGGAGGAGASGYARAVAHAAHAQLTGVLTAKQQLATADLTLEQVSQVTVGAAMRFQVSGASAPVDVSLGVELWRLDDSGAEVLEFIQGALDSTGWGGTSNGQAISDGGPGGFGYLMPLVDGVYRVKFFAWRADNGARGGTVTVMDGSAIAIAL